MQALQSPYRHSDDWQVLGTRNLIREATATLCGQIDRTPEAELALALLDRLTTTVSELADIRSSLDELDYD